MTQKNRKTQKKKQTPDWVIITLMILVSICVIGAFSIAISVKPDCEDSVYEESKFHGGIRFVEYNGDLGKCFWNNQEIDCLKAEDYINKNPEEYGTQE